jgi:hypothetical protein
LRGTRSNTANKKSWHDPRRKGQTKMKRSERGATNCS